MKGSFSIYSLLVCIIIVFLSSESTYVYAQNEVWIHAGLGISSLGPFGGSPGGSAGLSIQSKKLIFSFRMTANLEDIVFSTGSEFYDIGLLVGVATQNRKSHTSFSIGLARVTGIRVTENVQCVFFCFNERVDIDPTIGVPIVFQYFMKVSGVIGYGFNIYWNINNVKSFGGITLNLMLGKLR
ncbi:hypothetical protein IIC38_12325 [candidate division KSB1 bacterium]|nr:hypothetical protein [candidate division KSB1 bacterium]